MERLKMWTRVNRYVREHKLINSGDRILLGLSGGPDSICLARYLLSLREAMGLTLTAVHVNHLLRGEEADRDQAFAEEFCRQYALPLVVRKENAEACSRRYGLSLEEAGRKIRYRIFDELARDRVCNKIAIGHHRGDQAETLLFHALRGSGQAGLSGMKPASGRLIRPFLCVNRQEILDCLSRLEQDFCEDSTNAVSVCHRNYLRNDILPAMKKVNPGAEEHLAALADRMRDLLDYLEPGLGEAYESHVEETGEGDRVVKALVLQTIREDHAFVRGEIIYRAICRVAGGKKDIAAVHVQMVEKLLCNREGKTNSLPFGVKALRTGRGILLYKADAKGRAVPDSLPHRRADFPQTGTGADEEKADVAVPIPGTRFILYHEKGISVELTVESRKRPDGETGCPDSGRKAGSGWRTDLCGKTDCEVCLDYDKIDLDMVFRRRRPGDYYILDGSGHRKLLKRYFIDEKISVLDRKDILLLAQKESSCIIWISSGRISHPFKVTERTEKVLKICPA